MRKLGEQWVEEINGKRHMLKCVKQKAEISHIEEKIHQCHKCLFQMDDYDCAYPGDGWKCDMENGTIIKDLGILNEYGCLPAPWDDKQYPNIHKSLEIWNINARIGEVFMSAQGHTLQQAIDAWNRRA